MLESARGTTPKSFIPCATRRTHGFTESVLGRSMTASTQCHSRITPGGRYLSSSTAAAKPSWECGTLGPTPELCISRIRVTSRQENLVWGVDADGLDWRKALSDDNSAYVEVQGGLFRNQETYAFLSRGKVGVLRILDAGPRNRGNLSCKPGGRG